MRITDEPIIGEQVIVIEGINAGKVGKLVDINSNHPISEPLYIVNMRSLYDPDVFIDVVFFKSGLLFTDSYDTGGVISDEYL